jgi:hypothetical protein
MNIRRCTVVAASKETHGNFSDQEDDVENLNPKWNDRSANGSEKRGRFAHQVEVSGQIFK